MDHHVDQVFGAALLWPFPRGCTTTHLLLGGAYQHTSDRWWYHDSVFDTHAIARALTAAKLTSEQADAITDAVRQAAEHGEHVTPDMLRAEIATLRADLTWRMIAVGGLVVAALRLIG